MVKNQSKKKDNEKIIIPPRTMFDELSPFVSDPVKETRRPKFELYRQKEVWSQEI